MSADVQTLAEPELPPRQDEVSLLKGQFLASLNHEIRTPLSGILGMADLLLETSLSHEQHEYVSTAKDCAGQLLAMLNNILEYSALAAGTIRLEETDFHLPTTLEAAASEFEPAARAKGLSLVRRLAPDLPEFVRGDAFQLRKLLAPLLTNAVKYTAEGEIELAASTLGNGDGHLALSMSVRDTGIGIAPEKLGVIFESFRQLESGLARNYNGLGLGLALAEKVARMMGGHISVVSQPGRGSTFSLQIPLQCLEEAAEQRPPENAFAARAGAGYRILLVEDNHVAQHVVTRLLTKASYQIECADNGEKGIQAARRTRFDLILMDLQMPGMNGLETTGIIRDYQGVPILALTANYSDDYRRLCMTAGMQGFLPKPVRAQELLATVARFLR